MESRLLETSLCQEDLQAILRDGPKPAREVISKLMSAPYSFKERTIYRAKSLLGVQSSGMKKLSSRGNPRMWELPNKFFSERENAMLVLSRQLDEKIVIKSGEHCIVLNVVEILRGLVRLGFDAPKDVVIDREEIDAAKTSGD